MTILQRCKIALRISHNILDDTINDDIATARLEMRRAGVSDDVANSNNGLVLMAIVAYVQMKEGNEEKRDLYESAWRQQLDEIRKSGTLPGVPI